MEAETGLRIFAFSLLSVTNWSQEQEAYEWMTFLDKCLEQFPVGFWIGGVSAFKKSLLGFPDLFGNAISGKLILGEFVMIACSFIGFE